jgi:hypothetical protein
MKLASPTSSENNQKIEDSEDKNFLVSLSVFNSSLENGSSNYHNMTYDNSNIWQVKAPTTALMSPRETSL